MKVYEAKQTQWLDCACIDQFQYILSLKKEWQPGPGGTTGLLDQVTAGVYLTPSKPFCIQGRNLNNYVLAIHL